MANNYKIFDGTSWVNPCNREVRYLSSTNTFELIDPINRNVYYFDGNTWLPLNCQCTACPEGYVYNYETNVCERFETPSFTGNILNLVKSSTVSSFGEYGLTLYPSIGLLTNPSINLPIKTNGKSGGLYQVLDNLNNPITVLANNVNSALWGTGSQSNGRLNKIGLWADYATLANSSVSFEVCLNITEEKEYIFAFGADNFFKCDIDLNTTGSFTSIINFTQMVDPVPPESNFKIWHAFPIIFPAGNHIIRLYGKNDTSQCSFGAEIYNLDLATFQSTFANNTALLADLLPYIYFTTEKFIDIQVVEPGTLVGTYTCPTGSTFDSCRGVPICVIESPCLY